MPRLAILLLVAAAALVAAAPAKTGKRNPLATTAYERGLSHSRGGAEEVRAHSPLTQPTPPPPPLTAPRTQRNKAVHQFEKVEQFVLCSVSSQAIRHYLGFMSLF